MKRYKRNLIVILLLLTVVISIYVVIFQEKYMQDISLYEAQKTEGDRATGYDNIGVTLLENEREIAWSIYIMDLDGWGGHFDNHKGILFSQLLNETDGKLKFGYPYEEKISILNSGDTRIRTYDSVVIYTSFFDENDVPLPCDSSLVKLNFVNPDKWVKNEEKSNGERNVFNYDQVLEVGQTTPALMNSITLDPKLKNLATETEISNENGHKVIEINKRKLKVNCDVGVDVEDTH